MRSMLLLIRLCYFGWVMIEIVKMVLVYNHSAKS
jgi:hypothetical protein